MLEVRVVSGPSVQAIGESIRVRRCAPRTERLGEGRIGFAEAVGVAVSRVPDDVCVPESRSSGAIGSEENGGGC